MGSGIDEFAAYSKKHETQPIETSNLFNSFESITASKSSRRISPADTSSQLLYGRIDLGLFGGNAWSENYVVQRIAADITKSYLLGGSNVVLVANPGNGKTRCAEITGYLLASEGHRVYKYTNTSPSIRDEIKLLRLEKCFIIIEDALFRKEILSEFSYDNEILARFLFTSRKAAYEGQRSVLSSMCGGNINEIVLDKLPIEDCRGLLTITSNQGLDSWIPGRRSSQKLDHITDKCARELRAFVLSCFDNEEVRSKLDSIFADMAVSDSMERRFLFLILFCKWIGISLQQPDIETINRESYDKILNKKDHYLFHIVEEKSRYFDINSYALAEYVLRRYFSDRSITDNLLRIVQNNIMRGRYSRDPYYRIISQAMRFGAIEPFLSAHNKRGVILDYYSMLLDIEPVRDLPLFWLQYSIAYTAI